MAIMRKFRRTGTVLLPFVIIFSFIRVYRSRYDKLKFPVPRLSSSSVIKMTRIHSEDQNLESVGFSRELELHPDRTGARIVKRVVFNYPQFNITEPKFILEKHRRLFYLKSSNYDILGVPSSDKLLGQIYIVRNGSLELPCECGYKSNISIVLQDRDISKRYLRSVMPLIVPDGGTFQHFLDGVLPKLIQALEYLKRSQIKLMLEPIRNDILFEILAKLHISKDRIIYYKGNFKADYLVFSCNTPPLHPVLWQKARQLVGAPDKLLISNNKAKIVIITRDGCRNCDRKLLNTDALVAELQAVYSSERVSLFKRPYDLNKTIQLFSKTKVVIGTHGGGMYNINFCPVGTIVIEIMPTYSNGKTIAASETIFWTQSVLLGHQYWRLPTPPANYFGDVVVNITLIKKILEISKLEI